MLQSSFLSKDDALEYLAQLQKVKKKWTRDNSNLSNWKTTMMFKTNDYSFKVYHKGSEFKKNDRKQIVKTKLKYDVDHLQEFADRILRYEFTIRNAYTSYLFMSRLFRKDCHLWQSAYKLYKKYKSVKQTPKYLEWRRTITQEEKRQIDYVKSIIYKSKKFYLSKIDLDASYDTHTDEYYFNHYPHKKQRFYKPAHYSRELFNLQVRQFLKILKEFNLETKDANNKILHNLEILNSTARIKKESVKKFGYKHIPVADTREISKSKIEIILELLKTKTFEEIQQSDLFSRSTWWRIRKDLNLLGVTQKSLLDVTLNADFDLHNYNSHLLLNINQFKYIKLG